MSIQPVVSMPLPETTPVAPMAHVAHRAGAASGANGATLIDISASVLKEVAAADFPKLTAILDSAPLHHVADQIPNHIVVSAKFEAEVSLARASQLLAGASEKILPNWQTHPEALLGVANQLFDAGGYMNYLRSAYVAQIVAEYLPASSKAALEGNIDQTWEIISKRARAQLGNLWFRAPLLVLLLSWLALGLAVGLCSMVVRALPVHGAGESLFGAFYDVWGLGFLALVGFGFWARVRRVRF